MLSCLVSSSMCARERDNLVNIHELHTDDMTAKDGEAHKIEHHSQNEGLTCIEPGDECWASFGRGCCQPPVGGHYHCAHEYGGKKRTCQACTHPANERDNSCYYDSNCCGQKPGSCQGGVA